MKSETPNFDRIAARIAEGLSMPDGAATPTVATLIRAQLVDIWNARGAADLAKIESELAQLMGATASGPYLKNLDRALRALDR